MTTDNSGGFYISRNIQKKQSEIYAELNFLLLSLALVFSDIKCKITMLVKINVTNSNAPIASFITNSPYSAY